MSTNPGHHALVIGASGLIGWAVVNQLLQSYPSPSPFRKVTALVNRPLKLEDTYWSDYAPGTPELGLVSGVDLLCSDVEFERMLHEKVKDSKSITHVYYFAFKENSDHEKEVEINVGMMRRVVRTVKSLSSNFKYFVYPGGTRGYGIYRPEGVFTAPLVEEMADELPADYLKTVSYPHYRAMLTEESANQDWSWSEVVPDAIIGFTPNGSGFSIAGHWAVYLSVYRLVHGDGADITFPGTINGYDSLYSETSAATLARVAIFASLNPDNFNGKIFNVAESATPGSMRERWPQIASFFGLKGVPPLLTASASDPKPSEFIMQHEEKWKETGMKGVDIWNATQLDSYGYWLTFDRHLSLQRLRDAGFDEENRPEEGWWEAFKMFRRAGMIL